MGYNHKSKRLVYILVAVGALLLALIMRFGYGGTETAIGLVTSATAVASNLTSNVPVHTGPAPPAFSTPHIIPPTTAPVSQGISSTISTTAATPATPNKPITVAPSAANTPIIVEPPASVVIPTIKLAPRDAPFDVEVLA